MKRIEPHDLVMRYFDHDIGGQEMELLHAHLSSCADCAALFSDLNKIVGALERTPQVEPWPGLEDAVMARVRALSSSYDRFGSIVMKVMYGSIMLAASLLLSAAALRVEAAGVIGFLFQGIDYLGTLMQIGWSLQIFYHLADGLLFQMPESAVRMIGGLFVTGVAVALVLWTRIAWVGWVKQGTKD